MDDLDLVLAQLGYHNRKAMQAIYVQTLDKTLSQVVAGGFCATGLLLKIL